MQITVFKSKIHRATITGANLDYEGSITIDRDLLDAAGILPHERVQVVNLNNGNRFETYAMEAKRASGEIMLNGPAARLGLPGDLVIIISYALMTPEEARSLVPSIVLVDSKNKPVKKVV